MLIKKAAHLKSSTRASLRWSCYSGICLSISCMGYFVFDHFSMMLISYAFYVLLIVVNVVLTLAVITDLIINRLKFNELILSIYTLLFPMILFRLIFKLLLHAS